VVEVKLKEGPNMSVSLHLLPLGSTPLELDHDNSFEYFNSCSS
jgi:hypothetical protein